MNIEQPLRRTLIEQIWNILKVGQIEAEQVIALLEKENYYKDIIKSENEITVFINGNLQSYLYPNGMNRLKIYDQKYLDDNGITLDFIQVIPDGWDCNLYYDKKNSIYWEDNYGRYAKEGFKISPYIEPLKFYK